MTTVNIIGAGRVGQTVLRLLASQAQDVASATRASAEGAVLAAGHGRVSELDQMRAADIWLLTVPDTQIITAAEALAKLRVPPACAIHCSGFHTAQVMAPLHTKGWALASAHPNLSFADPSLAVEAFKDTPVGIEGDETAVNKAEVLFQSMGAKTFPIATDRKVLYHAAAVFSNNFATALQAVARDAWAEAGVPAELIPALNTALFNAAAENVERLGPKDALTGPAARGDKSVVDVQERVVTDWRPDAGQIYRDLSQLAARLKGR